MKTWYGCPHCTSPNYQTFTEIDGETISFRFVCCACRREFFRVGYWVRKDPSSPA